MESKETFAYRIFRACEKESKLAVEGQGLVLYLPPDMATFVTESLKGLLEDLEKRLSKRVMIRVDENLLPREFEVYAHDL